jgi:hypothetical protein
MQENIHSSLKRRLDGNCVLVHKFIPFLERILGNRKVNLQYKLGHQYGFEALKNSLKQHGGAEFVAAIDKCIIREGQDYLFRQFESGQAYEVKEVVLSDDLEINRLKAEIIPNRGAAALRLFMLIEQDFRQGCFYEVIHKEFTTATKNGVYFTKNGSGACTCGDTCTMGSWDRHLFAVLRVKRAKFVPFLHLHPSYLKPGMFDVKNKFTIVVGSGNPLNVTELASWDEPYKLTCKVWKEQGLGIIGTGLLRYTSPMKKSSEKLDKRKQLKNVVYQVLDYTDNDPALYDRVLLYFTGIVEEKSRAAERILTTTTTGPMQVPGASRKKSSKRTKSEAEKNRGG